MDEVPQLLTPHALERALRVCQEADPLAAKDMRGHIEALNEQITFIASKLVPSVGSGGDRPRLTYAMERALRQCQTLNPVATGELREFMMRQEWSLQETRRVLHNALSQIKAYELGAVSAPPNGPQKYPQQDVPTGGNS